MPVDQKYIEHAHEMLKAEIQKQFPHLSAPQVSVALNAVLADERTAENVRYSADVWHLTPVTPRDHVARVLATNPKLTGHVPTAEAVFEQRLAELEKSRVVSVEERLNLFRTCKSMTEDERIESGAKASAQTPSEQTAPEPATPTTSKDFHRWELNDERWTGELQRRGLDPHGSAIKRRGQIEEIQRQARAAEQKPAPTLKVDDSFLNLPPDQRIAMARAAGISR